jgi:hypothetical protein
MAGLRLGGQLAGLKNGQNCGARSHSVSDDLVKKDWTASKRGGIPANIMGGKYEPAPRQSIAIDHSLDRPKVVPALFEEKGVKIVEIGVSGIERLTRSAAAGKVFLGTAFGLRSGAAYRVGHGSEDGPRQKSV